MGLVYFMLALIVIFSVKQGQVIYKRGKYLRKLHEKEIEFFEYYKFIKKFYTRTKSKVNWRKIKHLDRLKDGFLAYQRLMKYDPHNVENPDRDFVELLKTDNFLNEAHDHIKKYGMKFKDEYRESRLDKLLKN